MEPQKDMQHQEQPFSYGPPVSPPLPDGPSQDFFWFRLNHSDMIDEIEHKLRGETYDKKSGDWIQKYEPDLNDQGINDILQMIHNFGPNKNVVLGNLTTEQINARCLTIFRKIAIYFLVYGNHVGLRKEKRGTLLWDIIYTVHSSLTRSEFGKEARELSTASQRIEHLLKEEKPKSDGLLNPFNIFRKNR